MLRLTRLFLVAVFAALLSSPALAVTTDQFVDRAQEFYERGELQASVIELKNALQQNPDSAAARLLLGRVYLEAFDPASAEKELLRARSLGVVSPVLTEALGQAWLRLRRFDNIIDNIEADPSASPRHRANVHILRGGALLGLERAAEAAESFHAALTDDPRNAEALAGLGQIAYSRNDLDTAEARLAEALAADPGSLRALRLKGDMNFSRGDFAEAEVAYRQLVHAFSDIQSNLLLAYAVAAQGKHDAALTIIHPVLDVAPEHPGVGYLRALVAFQTKDYEAAKFHVDQLVQVLPDHMPTHLLAGATNFALKNNEQALSFLRRYVNERPQDGAARRLLAATQLRLGQAGDAKETLAPLQEDLAPDDAALLALIGTAAQRSGDLEEGQQYLSRLVETQPENPVARAHLGAIELALGRTDDGILELEKALELDPTVDRVLYSIVVSHISNRDYQRAFDVAVKLRDRFPKNAQAWTLVGAAYAGLGDFGAASGAFERALTIRPGATDAGSSLANLKIRQGNMEAARTLYRHVLEHNPDHLRTLLQLALLENRLDRPTEELGLLERAVGLYPESRDARGLLGRAYMERGEPLKALDATADLVDLDSDDAALLEIVAGAYLRIGNAERSLGFFQRLVELDPDNTAARFDLARVYERQENFSEADSQLRKVLALDARHRGAKFVLARVRAAQRDLASAKELVAELKAQNPNSQALLDLEARIALAEKRPADAVGLLERAHAMRDNRRVLILLAKAQARAGAVDAGMTTLQDWLDRHPDDVQVRQFLARSYLELGRYDDAHTEYGELVARLPDNVAALKRLAWLDWRLGSGEQGLVRARRALELAPNDPEVMDTLGVILVDQGESAEALPLLRRANQLLPHRPSVRFHLARALAADGDEETARRILIQLVGIDREFAERAEAEALLRRLR